jgi:hypothetical protein
VKGQKIYGRSAGWIQLYRIQNDPSRFEVVRRVEHNQEWLLSGWLEMEGKYFVAATAQPEEITALF